jgi:hypothetical protein
MADPGLWTFGLNQLLTVAGLAVAYFGVRTFGKWRKEKIEERRIELALEGLSLAYESKEVFKHIRSRVIFTGEGADVPPIEDESDKDKRQRQSFYAVLKRIEASNEFFTRVWKLQPKFIAIFGDGAEEIFDQLHSARRNIEAVASAGAFERVPTSLEGQALAHYKQELTGYRTTIFGSSSRTGISDPVGEKLDDFRKRMDDLCRPVIHQTYKGARERWWQFWRHRRNKGSRSGK